jgi:hypothetical protein
MDVYTKMLKVSKFGIIFQIETLATIQARMRMVIKPQFAESSKGCPPVTRE